MTRWFCSDCGAAFFRNADETWKTRCVPCFVKHKNTRAGVVKQPASPDYRTLWEKVNAECFRLQRRVADLEQQLANRPCSPLEPELREYLPRLVQLAHPDRHGGSLAANRATQWLLDVKRRLHS